MLKREAKSKATTEEKEVQRDGTGIRKLPWRKKRLKQIERG